MAADTTEEKNDPPAIINCTGCDCIFFNKEDLHRHKLAFPSMLHREELKELHDKMEHDTTDDIKNQWIPSKFGGPEKLLLASKDPELAKKIQAMGYVRQGSFIYKLSGKWIVKTPTK